MRLSTLKTDSGYKPDAELKRFAVYLNGQQETMCEVADEEHGYIIRVMRVWDKFARRAVVRRSPKIFGKVEIREHT